MDCAKEKLLANVAVPPAPVRVPSQRPLAPSVAPVLFLANDTGERLGPFVHGAMGSGQKSLS